MYLKEKKMKNTTAWLNGPEKSYSKQALRTMIRSFLKKVKETRSGEVLNQSSKQLEINGKPNSPTNWNINSTNRDMPRGHNLWSAATAHLMRHEIPRVAYSKKKKKKKKAFSSSMVVVTFRDNHRIWGQLTGLTKSIRDESSKTDEANPKTSPKSIHITNENRRTIRCHQ